MTEYKERIQKDDEEIPANKFLNEKIKMLQQERDRLDEPGPFRRFNRPKIQELDDEIEKLKRRMRV